MWLNVLGAIIMNAIASAMLKLASQPPFKPPSIDHPLAVLTNWPLLLGLVSYCIAFVLYAVAVSQLPLSIVYPVLTSGGISLVVLISLFLFNEPINMRTAAGIFFVLVGVALIAPSS
jgi:small multidrug resistance pump